MAFGAPCRWSNNAWVEARRTMPTDCNCAHRRLCFGGDAWGRIVPIGSSNYGETLFRAKRWSSTESLRRPWLARWREEMHALYRTSSNATGEAFLGHRRSCSLNDLCLRAPSNRSDGRGVCGQKAVRGGGYEGICSNTLYRVHSEDRVSQCSMGRTWLYVAMAQSLGPSGRSIYARGHPQLLVSEVQVLALMGWLASNGALALSFFDRKGRFLAARNTASSAETLLPAKKRSMLV